MQITMEQAYSEAITALGEATVKERLLNKRIAELEAAQPTPQHSQSDTATSDFPKS